MGVQDSLDQVLAEMSNRRVMLRGAGDPNGDSGLDGAPAGSLYWQDSGVEWIHLAVGPSNWTPVGSATTPPETVRYVGPNSTGYENGSQLFPYTTAQDGINDIIAIETADPTARCELIVAPGSYIGQTISLENENLTNISIVCAPHSQTARDGLDYGATFSTLSAAVDTENLVYLHLVGLRFINGSIQCDVTDGDLCSVKGSVMKSCQFTNLTLGQMTLFNIEECKVLIGFTVTNCTEVWAYRSQLASIGPANAIIEWDEDAPKPLFGVSTFLYVEGDVLCKKMTTRRVGSPGGDVFVSFKDGSRVSSDLTVGADCAVTCDRDGILPADTTVDAGGAVTIEKGGEWNVSTATTINSAAVVSWPKDAENADVDTGTETVDEFPDTAGASVMWFVHVQKGANVARLILAACWDAATNAFFVGMPMTLAFIGTIDVTVSADLVGDNVRLRATATSDDWTVRVIERVIS